MTTPDPKLVLWLQSLLADPQLQEFELVQSLWSDFGQLLRCYSPARQSHLIIKLIREPASFKHPRGWNSQHSQQRKWRSYQIEQHFYQNYAARLASDARVAELIVTDQQHEITVLVLSDLNEAGFPVRHHRLNAKTCRPVLAWLAAFHATFMQQPAEGLWSQGSYWHLATRQDEYDQMADGPLKQYAARFDQALRECPYQTLIHGDAKVANFCFSEDGKSVAAVDFQYVGGGTGVQDVAYFLGSVMSDNELSRYTDDCLAFYFDRLKEALGTTTDSATAKDICQHWQDLYCVANADFHRFLAGWSPSHSKINPVLQDQTDQAIDYVRRATTD
ncbi:phosphotransferase [Alteromonas lipolytica]|uniref:CHK kinase-like domain-containing protein n=1 Tax=Alteromonas lipolytica TaxID=1856405 RepID=A0A1E8FIM8_9ALTE|nr:phosphotransferase [Alteromonas lipolytica]OFI35800.1 hypothetical protein BFC17_11000 [Alteromonas lipolytica]GGF80931.1 phosphotransferase [Alteromonas lipolytica]